MGRPQPADTPHHLLPQDLPAEEASLGAMMLSQRAIDLARELGITADDYFRPSHRTIFNAVMHLADQEAVDELTVVHRLQSLGVLGEVGGAAAVLTLVERCPAVANARSYFVALREAAIRRGLVTRGHEIARMGYEPSEDAASLVPKAGQLIDELGGAVSGEDGITTAADELMPFVYSLEERMKRGGELAGLPTGLTRFDERTGGLLPGTLTIVAARPGMGKSAWLGGVAETVAFGSCVDVYLVNLEMREQQQVGRMLARAGGVDLRKTTRGVPTDEDVERASARAAELMDGARRIHLDQSSDLTVNQIRYRAARLNRRLKREGRSLGLIGVDYLQLITPPAGERNENAALTVISRGLKCLALELQVPVVALAQLNREVENRTPPRPRLSDLRGSGSIEQDADTVLFLYRPEYYMQDATPLEQRGFAEGICAKVREGEPGIDPLAWDGSRTRYSDWGGGVFMAGMGVRRG